MNTLFEKKLNLIRALSKTGFLTKDQWEKYFFTGGKTRWRDESWRQLTVAPIFALHPNPLLRNTLVLNRKSKQLQNLLGHKAVHPPHISQLPHDEVLMNGIYELQKSKTLLDWQSEAELKMFTPIEYKIETQGQLIKYPDALLKVSTTQGIKIAALELEKTQKAKKRYVQIFGAYASMKGIDTIICICGSNSIKEMMDTVVKEIFFPTERIPIFYINESNWKQNPVEIFTAHPLLNKHEPFDAFK